MLHAIVYYGPFEQNFHLLSPKTDSYVLSSGKQSGVVQPPSKVEGLVFGCMQDGDIYRAVKAENVIVRVSVTIIPGTHTPLKPTGKGKEFGPVQYTFIADDNARQLLEDMAEANPLQKKALLALLPA